MSKQYKILVLNGPNLGHLGEREPEIYGTQGLSELPSLIFDNLGNFAGRATLQFDQLNGEGAMIDRIEQARVEGVAGIVLNAGAYTHTSLALADCLAWVGIPTVEVHISNILARSESIRHRSMLATHCIGVISGFGLYGYALAATALLRHLDAAQGAGVNDATPENIPPVCPGGSSGFLLA